LELVEKRIRYMKIQSLRCNNIHLKAIRLKDLI
ncbi:hypothetical protein T4C_2822, partial [Trichinella pseudospiralis]